MIQKPSRLSIGLNIQKAREYPNIWHVLFTSQMNKNSLKNIFLIISILISLILISGCTSQDTSSINTSESSNFQNARFLSITNGTYSINATVPVVTGKMMTYTIEKPNYSWQQASSLAKKLGMFEEIRENEYAYIANETYERKLVFAVSKSDNTISYRNFSGVSPGTLTSAEAMKIVNDLLMSVGILPKDIPEPDFNYQMSECPLLSGENDKNCKIIDIFFTRKINSYQIAGWALKITIGHGGQIGDMIMTWPEYHPYKEVSIKSPEQAFVEIQTKRPFFIGLGNPITPEKIVVTQVELIYVKKDGKYLIPTYVFYGYGQQGDRQQEFDAIQIPASSEELE